MTRVTVTETAHIQYLNQLVKELRAEKVSLARENAKLAKAVKLHEKIHVRQISGIVNPPPSRN